MRDIDNTRLVQLVGGSNVETIVSHDVVGRVMIQSARMRGLADVFSSILGFEDDEIYVKSWPEFTGSTFETVIRAFDRAVPIGISVPSDNNGEPDKVILNPPGTHVMRLNEKIVVLAEDDDSYEPILEGPKIAKTKDSKTGKSIRPPQWKENPVKEKILMTGWRRDIDDGK